MGRLKTCPRCGRIHPVGECKIPKYSRMVSKRKEQTSKLRSSSRWQHARKQALERDKYLCRWCLAKYNTITTTNLQVHHITPIYDNTSMAYDIHNLITVCSNCHTMVEGKYKDELYRLTDMHLELI